MEDVVDKSGEFGPERGGGLPEEGVYWDGKDEAEKNADETSWDDIIESKGDAWLEIEIDGVAREKEGNF